MIKRLGRQLFLGSALSTFWLISVFVDFTHSVSIVKLQSGVAMQGILSSADDRSVLPNYYVLNVSNIGYRDTKLSVRLKQVGGDAMGLVLSICPGMLPCGDLGCACPSKYVDSGARTKSDSNDGSIERRINVSPCELDEGLWYISVELDSKSLAQRNGMTSNYMLTAMLEYAQIDFGKTTSGSICCQQTEYFVFDVEHVHKNYELRIKLEADNRQVAAHPLGLSASPRVCGADRDDAEAAGPGMTPAIILGPKRVRAGRLYVGVRAVGRAESRFLLTATYRPEIKWVVVAILAGMVLTVLGTCAVVCVVRFRRRVRKHQEFAAEVGLRRLRLRQGSAAAAAAAAGGGGDDRGHLIDGSDDSEGDL